MSRLANFAITRDQLVLLKRHVSNPRDCALIALHILGILNPKTHAIASILIDDKGVNDIPMLEVLKYKFGKDWMYKEYLSTNDFMAELKNFLLPGCITLCALKWKTEGLGHVSMVARDVQTGELYYMDPQSGVFKSLDDPYIIEMILEKSAKFGLLHTTYSLGKSHISDPRRPSILQ